MTAARQNTTQSRKVGLLAGWGRYPFVVAEALNRQGFEVYGLGVKGHADPALAELCAGFDWIGLAKLGGACRHFRRWGVADAMMSVSEWRESRSASLARRESVEPRNATL